MAEYIEKATLLNRVIIPSICSCVQGPTAERLKKFCIDTVNSISAADVAPVVHGRWTTETYGIPSCSVCGMYVSKKVYNPEDATPPYCPNCGAKMDEVSDGT